MEIGGIECEDPTIIGNHVYDSHHKIFKQKNPYKLGDVHIFLGEEGIKQMGKIKPEMSEMVYSNFSFIEVSQVISNLKPNKNGGPDTITSDLLKILFKLCPYLIICVIHCISNALNGDFDYFAKRFIMFILKLNSSKKDIKNYDLFL